MSLSLRLAAAFAALLTAVPSAASAQRTEGDAHSPLAQLGRMYAEPGTFWLDDSEDREVVRYTTPRDIRLCLPEPSGISGAERSPPVRVTWDQTSSATLYPGNCLFFDARRVSLRPAGDLPRGVVLRGSIEATD